MDTKTQHAIDTLWKMEAARIIGGLARLVGDIGLAEDLAQDALISALEQWPAKGIPPKPGAWLMATARNKAIDRIRRDANFRRKLEAIGHTAEVFTEPEDPRDVAIEDDVLRLIFTACHPALTHDAQIALTLRIVCGLTTAEIARAHLTTETTVQQRIVRAKRKLSDAGVKFDDLEPSMWAERLEAVLMVIYLIYNEGYAASSGEDYLRPSLSEEALRLGRMLAQMVRDDAEVYALLALMELQTSRSRARIDRLAVPVPLLEQNRGHWDRLQIGRGLAALEAAKALRQPAGVYFVQAAIAACHARALTPEATDWPQIAALYGLLSEMTGSPVVRLNQAMAEGMAFGPERGLARLTPLQNDPDLATYHLLWSAKGELLHRAGHKSEAKAAFKKAAEMTLNTPERQALLKRAEACV